MLLCCGYNNIFSTRVKDMCSSVIYQCWTPPPPPFNFPCKCFDVLLQSCGLYVLIYLLGMQWVMLISDISSWILYWLFGFELRYVLIYLLRIQHETIMASRYFGVTISGKELWGQLGGRSQGPCFWALKYTSNVHIDFHGISRGVLHK